MCTRYYKHATQTWFSRTVTKGYDIMSRLVMTYETFDICDICI